MVRLFSRSATEPMTAMSARLATPTEPNTAATARPATAAGRSLRRRQLIQMITGRKTMVGPTPMASAPRPWSVSQPRAWPACISIWAP
jgi:hypothetical protein